MCKSCNGLGTIVGMDPSKIVADQDLTIREGAVIPWKNYFLKGETDDEGSWSGEKFSAMKEQWGVDFDVPWKKLPAKLRKRILHGGNELEFDGWTYEWEGILPAMMRRYLKTKSDLMKTYYQKYMSSKPCESCEGKKIKTRSSSC